MNDLELHNLVKQSLNEFKPPFEEKHWRLMQFKLIIAPVAFPWKLFATVAAPVAVATVVWYQSNLEAVNETPPSAVPKVQIEAAVVAAPLYTPRIPQAIKALPLQPEDKPVEEETVIDHRPSIIELTGKPITLQFQVNPPSSLKTFFLEQRITSLLKNNTIENDSTTYNALDRNKDKWSNAAVVCDWTSSMFKYGTQIFTWLDQNQNNDGLKAYIFFTDCDSSGVPLKSGSSGGAMYHTREKEPSRVLEVMLTAVRQGTANLDLIENDLEALQFASAHYREVDELVLIADNMSPVRDPFLLQDLQKPVRIILCGSTMTDDAIQPIYLDLARRTGGSIHTNEDDLEDLSNIPDGRWIRVADTYYRYKAKKNKFVATNRKHRPRSY